MITSKAALNPLIQNTIDVFAKKGEDAFVKTLHSDLLQSKIRFPLLEHAAESFCKTIPAKHHYSIAAKIMQLDTIGGNVLVGIFLQLRLETELQKAFRHASEHIVAGDLWYVCDIIGERVFGYALLTQPEETIYVLKKMAKHKNTWLVRTVGVATHYAVKKGLKKKHVEEMFALLLTLSKTTDLHTKKGIGWAAKTCAKFHPEIIQTFKPALASPEIKPWFKTKIRIGLGRSEKYASRYHS